MSSPTSSDSERGRRVVIYPRPPPPPPPPPPPIIKPKKKKKTLPPQETINKIWSRFSAPKFSQATTILPSASASGSKAKKCPPVKPKGDNVLVSEDYDRAVQECRARVKKLVRECKRVNMRYRDPDFDIDWDLKWEKGYCLNGLGGRKFEINGRAFANPSAKVPKAVKRVHEIFDKPTFLNGKVSPADIRQGSLGDCWLMASLTALANMEVGIHRICVEYDTKVGIYGFVFHRDGEWIISIIDDKLYMKSPDWDSPSVQRHLLEQIDREDVEKVYRRTYQTGSQALFFAHCADQNETWLPLLEKAYAKAHGDFAALAGGWIGEGVEDLTGGVTTELLTSDILDTDEFWENEILKVNKEFLFGCSTGLLDGGYGTREGISEGHAYVIMEARELSTGERLLKLRNPWGKGKKGQWEGAWSDGSKEFTPEAQLELKHKFGSDSVFWISYQDLLRKYQHFDRTRLFMDSPDWRVTQKWVSIDVPWKAEFQQMFRIVLKKESPIVLVLGQLDDRYFDGLQGQYIYRLQFRLHEAGSPGDEDYIVRSHGNYLMDRSVVTELKFLAPGAYTVFIQVFAERDIDEPSVEDVVKKACKKKEDNDKLIQVGASYDYAHNRAAVHLEALTAARKAADKQKARETRIATRKKNWQKRHLGREIARKQEKKNREKCDAKDAKDDALAKEREDKRHLGREIARKQEKMNREKRDAKDAKDDALAKEKEDKKPKDKGVQTEEIIELKAADEVKGGEDPNAESDNTIVLPQPPSSPPREMDKSVQTDDMSDSQTAETPRSSSVEVSPRMRLRRMPSARSVDMSPRRRLRRIPSDGSFSDQPIIMRDRNGREPPPPAPRNYPPAPRHYPQAPRHYPQRARYISDGDTSASPVEDFEDMYSDDDPTLGPRPILPAIAINPGGPIPPPPGGLRPPILPNGSDDDDNVEPWNAVCIVGFRVYSQDEELELVIYDETMDQGEPEKDSLDEAGTDGDAEDEEGDSKKQAKTAGTMSDTVSNSDKVADGATDVMVPAPTGPVIEGELLQVDEEKGSKGLKA